TGGPVSSVPEVIARLEQIRTYAEAHEERGQHDGVACFTFLYHRITSRVLEGIDSGRFADDEFVALLDVVFANRYLSALRASVLEPDTVPDAWSVLFERRAHRLITPLQFAAAGVNAHVNFDLAVAVVDTCSQLASEPNAGIKHQSYQEINKIFAEEMQYLREHFESTWERLIDGTVLGRVLNAIDDWMVVGTRDVAWEAAQHLWRLRQRHEDESEFVDHLDDLAGELGRAVLIPVL
ncbi:MAG TPA: DUF5995 family protein, partial [Actinomycetota bacterium]|nr:DUF5995 family protein [Actinomycetota bacterium]